MGVIKVATRRLEDIFVSEEPIGNLCAVIISATDRKIKLSTNADTELMAGANVGGLATSGKPVRVVTHGEVSGLIAGAPITAGDRLTGAMSGRVIPLNTITVSGAILLASGLLTSGGMSGHLGVEGTTLINAGGLVSGVAGFLGAPFKTGRNLGRALDTVLSGGGLRVLVAIGG